MKRSIILFIVLALSHFVRVLPACADELSEFEVKAAFLLNFTKFVEWPENVFEDSTSPIRIGVLGENPFGTKLDKIVRNKTVHGRKIVVSYSQDIERLRKCHLVFVSSSEEKRKDDIIDYFSSGHSLIVSDLDGFTRSGGTIGFVMNDRKIRFEINIDAAETAGLSISSKLLKLAKIVETRN